MRNVAATLIVGLALLCSGNGMAEIRDNLDGWGPFKFNMTRKQAMNAVSGRALTGSHGEMIYEVDLNGEPWSAELRFLDDPDGAIRNISLSPRNKLRVSTEAECIMTLDNLVSQVSKRYSSPTERTRDNGIIPLYDVRYASYIRFQDGSNIEIVVTYGNASGICGQLVAYNPPNKGATGSF